MGTNEDFSHKSQSQRMIIEQLKICFSSKKEKNDIHPNLNLSLIKPIPSFPATSAEFARVEIQREESSQREREIGKGIDKDPS